MEKIVEVKNLSKKYGKQQILKDVSFELSEREIVGFIGPNGAGKSTTMKCLCSLIFPDAGSIQICGYDLKTEREKALGNLSAMIESPALYPNLTGMQNLKLFANLKQVSNERIKELEVFTKLEKDLHKKVSKYSMGMKQRLALGIALLNKPKFIILDEPTNGLDPSGIIELREILQELKTKENVSILFSSHIRRSRKNSR